MASAFVCNNTRRAYDPAYERLAGLAPRSARSWAVHVHDRGSAQTATRRQRCEHDRCTRAGRDGGPDRHAGARLPRRRPARGPRSRRAVLAPLPRPDDGVPRTDVLRRPAGRGRSPWRVAAGGPGGAGRRAAAAQDDRGRPKSDRVRRQSRHREGACRAGQRAVWPIPHRDVGAHRPRSCPLQRPCGRVGERRTVLRDLAPALRPSRFRPVLATEPAVADVARLGYLLEWLEGPDIAAPLHRWIEARPERWVPLVPGAGRAGIRNPRWRIVINESIEPD